MFSISVPLPGLDDATVKELKKLMDGLVEASGEGPVRGGVASEGDAAAYALVWEWGNARQTQPGPKTVLGTGPDGEAVYLSIQAPMGYIRINESDYVKILETQLAEMNLDLSSGPAILKAIKRASVRAAELIVDVIKDTAPRDSGDLADSITAMDPDDPDLELENQELELGSGFRHEAMRKALKKIKKDSKRGR